MPGPRPAGQPLRSLRPALLVAVAGLLPATAATGTAQTRRAPTPDWSWYLTAGVGLIAREIRTWNPTHLALAPTGWDSRFQTSCVFFFCQNASDNVEGRPAAPSVALRRRLDDTWQLRLLGAVASPGYYPGGYGTTPLTVRPTTTTVAAQALVTLKGFWVAAGPSYYRGRLVTSAGPSRSTAGQSGVGLVLTGGATFPRVTNWFFEATVERRFAGSITAAALPVPGSPDVPALTVPLSATVLSFGVGWRL